MLRVEIERRLVCASLSIAVVTVTIPSPPTQQQSLALAVPALRSQPTKPTTRRTTATQCAHARKEVGASGYKGMGPIFRGGIPGWDVSCTWMNYPHLHHIFVYFNV